MDRISVIKEYKEPLISAINKTLDNLYDTKDLKEIQNQDFDTIEKVARAYEKLRDKIKKEQELTNFEYAELVIILTNVASYMGKMSENYRTTAGVLQDISQKILES